MSDTQDYRVTMRIIRLARIARTAANASITTKRLGTQFNPETNKSEPTMRDDTDIVGNEATILSGLIRLYLNPSELQET